MPLNWNVSKVENYKELFNKEDQMHEPFSTIILCTMPVGMNEITEENHVQFFNRLNLIEKIQGTYFYKNRSPKYITIKEVRRLIGLRTNASKKTKGQFLKDVFSESDL